MNHRRYSLFLATCAVWWLALSAAEAASPFARLVPFTPAKADADAETEYAITEDNGPWMIMATTFRGEGGSRDRAVEQAHELVQELRKKFKLPAYTYEKKFDFSKGTEGRGVNRFNEPRKMHYLHDDDVVEIAVLVGNYPNVADPEAQRVLKIVKYAEPECLKPSDGKPSKQSLGGLRMFQKALLPDGAERKKYGPMGQAFVMTNPLLPPEYYAPKGIDKLVLEMNKGVKHTLLNCPDRYTVKVATFTGQTILINRKVEEILEKGGTPQSQLAHAAEKAHRLTEVLRKKPYEYEAYEFHDRYSSIVTIGSFPVVGTQRKDGKIELDPRIHMIMKTFGAEPGKGEGEAPKPKTLGALPDIPFDVQPIPVEVPRRSIASDYSTSAN